MSKLQNILDTSDALDEKLHIVLEVEAFTSNNIKLLTAVDAIDHNLYEFLLQEVAARTQTDRILATVMQKLNGLIRSSTANIHTIRVDVEKYKTQTNNRIEKLEKLAKERRYERYLILVLVIIIVCILLYYNPEILKTILMLLHGIGNVI